MWEGFSYSDDLKILVQWKIFLTASIVSSKQVYNILFIKSFYGSSNSYGSYDGNDFKNSYNIFKPSILKFVCITLNKQQIAKKAIVKFFMNY